MGRGGNPNKPEVCSAPINAVFFYFPEIDRSTSGGKWWVLLAEAPLFRSFGIAGVISLLSDDEFCRAPTSLLAPGFEV